MLREIIFIILLSSALSFATENSVLFTEGPDKGKPLNGTYLGSYNVCFNGSGSEAIKTFKKFTKNNIEIAVKNLSYNKSKDSLTFNYVDSKCLDEGLSEEECTSKNEYLRCKDIVSKKVITNPNAKEMKKALSKYFTAKEFDEIKCNPKVKFLEERTTIAIYNNKAEFEISAGNKKSSSLIMEEEKGTLILTRTMEDGDEANGAYTIEESIQIKLTDKGDRDVYASRSIVYESGKELDFEEISCIVKK